MKSFLSVIKYVVFLLFVYNCSPAQPDIAWQAIHPPGADFLEASDGNYILYGPENTKTFVDTTFSGTKEIQVSSTNEKDGNINWVKTYGGPGNEIAKSMIELKDGNFLLIATTDSAGEDVNGFHQGNEGSTDVWVVKINKATGDTMWTKTLGGPGNESYTNYWKSFVIDRDGNVILLCGTDSSGGDIGNNWHMGYDTIIGYDLFTLDTSLVRANDIWVVKLNYIDGAIISNKVLGSTSSDYFDYSSMELAEDSMSIYLLSGVTKSDGDVHGVHIGLRDFIDPIQDDVFYYPTTDAWIVKLDNNLDTVWTKALGSYGDEFYDYSRIHFYDDAIYLVTSTDSNSGDVSGWHSSYDSLNDTIHNNIPDIWVAKITVNGQYLWGKAIGTTSYEVPRMQIGVLHAFREQNNNSLYTANAISYEDKIIVTGWLTDSSLTNIDYFMAQLDTATGNILWENQYGGNANDFLAFSYKDVMGSIYLIGSTMSDDIPGFHGVADWWVIKIDVSGAVIWQRLLGGNNNEELIGFQVTCDGNLLLSGDTYTSDASGDVTLTSPCNGSTTIINGTTYFCENLWCVKVDTLGNILWDKLFSSSLHDEDFVAHVTKNGFVFLGFAANGDTAGDKNIEGFGSWLIKFDLLPDFEYDMFCESDTVNFMDLSSYADEWIWYFGDGDSSMNMDPAHKYVEPGDYDVTLIVHQECDWDTMIKLITVDPKEVKLGLDTIICPSEKVLLDAGLGKQFIWYLNDTLLLTNVDSSIMFVRDSGVYTVEVTTKNGCHLYDTFNLALYPIKGGIITNDTAIKAKEIVLVEATGGGSYEWSPIDGLSCLDCPILQAAPEQTTLYLVQITDKNNCILEDSILITVYEKPNITVPNIFSPNGDGMNDYVDLFPEDIKELLYFKIFNRWGEMIFESADLDLKWDGKYDGQLQEIGVYYYKIHALSQIGTEYIKDGNIILIR